MENDIENEDVLKVPSLFEAIKNIFPLDNQQVQLEIILFIHTRILEFTDAFFRKKPDCTNILELILREALKEQLAELMVTDYMKGWNA